jgi:hypothetical protein
MTTLCLSQGAIILTFTIRNHNRYFKIILTLKAQYENNFYDIFLDIL